MQKFQYSLQLKKGETTKLVLPDMKYDSYFLTNMTISGKDHTLSEIKLTGKDPLLTINEALFYQSSSFNFQDQLSQIIASPELILTLKNLNNAKDVPFISINVDLTYSKVEGNIIYSNCYINLNVEGVSGILDELKKLSKHITKLAFVSPNKLSSIEFKPLCTSLPEQYPHHTFIVDSYNKIIIDINETDPYLIDNLKYYSLVVPDNIEKLGIIVYGFN